jgi:hypothetical protein
LTGILFLLVPVVVLACLGWAKDHDRRLDLNPLGSQEARQLRRLAEADLADVRQRHARIVRIHNDQHGRSPR